MDRGITVTEIAPMGSPVDAGRETTAAFIGRALRGPLDTPVLVENFNAFKRRFGGIWHRSSLGPAVQQFFEHGGRRLYVVRVANNARGAMICLPASHGVLVLHAIEPGSTEMLRASVDYDDIEDDEHFNLTVQRVKREGDLVFDQEIYHGLGCDEADANYVGDVLMHSSLVSVQLPLPPTRPASTCGRDGGFESPYIGPAQGGSDGSPLTDYDLVGSATAGTGIFALNGVDQLDLLYLPPPDRHADVGPAAILAAELYCRKRGAMLIMDPPATWTSASAAIEGIRDSGQRSANILAYYPPVMAIDDVDAVPRAAGGAIAGLLCKLDRSQGPWQDLDQTGFGFDRRLRPALEFGMGNASTLVRAGVNVIAGNTGGRAMLCGSVTLGCANQMERPYGSLPARRLCLAITNAIDRATRWAVFEPQESGVAERIHAQVHAFMSGLADAGAFEVGDFEVHCDSGLLQQPIDPDRGITILLAFQPLGAAEPMSLTVHQTVAGCRVATTAFAPVAAA